MGDRFQPIWLIEFTEIRSRSKILGPARRDAISMLDPMEHRPRHTPLGSIRLTVPTRSMDLSNEATLLIPVLSAQATR